MQPAQLFTISLALLAMPMLAAAQSTRPSEKPSISNDDTEVIATAIFNEEEYDGARPLLQALAGKLKADPNQRDKVKRIEEEIRICQKNHVSTLSPEAAKAAGSTDVRTPHPAPKAGEVPEMTLYQLGNFEFDAEKGSQIPDDVKALSGTTVRVTGYMIPIDAADHIGKFCLVPKALHSFPAVQRTIVVTCPKGKTVSFQPDKITIEGKLTVEVVKDDGDIVSIFQMETADVKPVAKK